MSTPTSLVGSGKKSKLSAVGQQKSRYKPASATSAMTSKARDLIVSKFDQLARKTLDELHNAQQSREFIQAIDTILTEDSLELSRRVGGVKAARRKSKLMNEQTSEAIERLEGELVKRCEQLAECQRNQQEQLNNHQAILFDKQYRSLPVEITGALPVRSSLDSAMRFSDEPSELGSKRMTTTKPIRQTATTLASRDKNAGVGEQRKRLSESEGKQEQRQLSQRSAIPTSTVVASLKPTHSPLTKSATTGSFYQSSQQQQVGQTASTQMLRQSSLRLRTCANGDLVESLRSQRSKQEAESRETSASKSSERSNLPSLRTGEKIQQHLPTRSNILDNIGHAKILVGSDDDDDDDVDDDVDDDDDDDHEDDDYQYANLASRRAYLNERFISPTSQLKAPAVIKSKTFAGSNKLVPAMGATGRPSLAHRANPHHRLINNRRSIDSDENDTEEQQPRSIDGLLTGAGKRAGTNVYKPHMNYSTSISGAHRLSDEDEIIIIPTARSPSRASPLILSASQSPISQNHTQIHDNEPEICNQQQHQDLIRRQQCDIGLETSEGNLDELSERFSISRTKSFWEQLANSKKQPTAAPSPVTMNATILGDTTIQKTTGDANNNQKRQHTHPSEAVSHFGRLDSTGNSGNSQYSGCSSNSSTSGDEHLHKLTKASGYAAGSWARRQPAARSDGQARLVSTQAEEANGDQIQRADKFRQTR